MKPRQFIARIGKKKLAKLGNKLPFSSISSPRKAVRKSKRKPSETLRIYGPIARRKWMKTLPCSACGVVGYSEGAHVLGNGGTGRKADADTQAPLCGPHTIIESAGIGVWDAFEYIGCHKLFDEQIWEFCACYPDYDPKAEASKVQIAWLSIKGEKK